MLSADRPTSFSPTLPIFVASPRNDILQLISPQIFQRANTPRRQNDVEPVSDDARVMSVGGKFFSSNAVWNDAKLNFNIKRTPSSTTPGYNVERIHIFSSVTAKVVTQFSCLRRVSVCLLILPATFYLLASCLPETSFTLA